jgi:hypothetical protein
MHLRLSICLAFILLILSACQSTPPTQIVLVVTATPSEGEITEENAETLTPAITLSATQSITQTAVRRTQPPPLTPSVAFTPTIDPFPTPTITQIQVAEQVFEKGRMFWLEPASQIWVLAGEDEGQWERYEDTFEEGEPEMDPRLNPPEGFEQPLRGFGKLWRENDDVREALGWAVTPEFGYVSNYEYHPGGQVNRAGVYVAAPGYHVVFSLYGERFRFFEEDSSWQRG